MATNNAKRVQTTDKKLTSAKGSRSKPSGASKASSLRMKSSSPTVSWEVIEPVRAMVPVDPLARELLVRIDSSKLVEHIARTRNKAFKESYRRLSVDEVNDKFVQFLKGYEDGNQSTNGLLDEYQYVLDVALASRLSNTYQRLGNTITFDSSKIDAIKSSIINVVKAGQASNMPPKKLQDILVSKHRAKRSHSSWQRDEAKEMNAGLLIGAPRFIKAS